MSPLIVTLKDQSGRSLLSENVELFQHKEYREMGKDIWIPNQQAIGPKIRIRLTYNYSEIQKFTSLE